MEVRVCGRPRPNEVNLRMDPASRSEGFAPAWARSRLARSGAAQEVANTAQHGFGMEHPCTLIDPVDGVANNRAGNSSDAPANCSSSATAQHKTEPPLDGGGSMVVVCCQVASPQRERESIASTRIPQNSFFGSPVLELDWLNSSSLARALPYPVNLSESCR